MILSACALWAAPSLEAQSESRLGDWKVETFRWTGTDEATRSVTVRNPHGNVRLRKAETGKAFTSAAIQRHGDDPRLGDIRVEEADGKVTIEVGFSTPEGFDPAKLTEEMAKHRIDITVLVPAEARLEVQTEDGDIEGKGLESDVTASSTTGDIVLSIDGSLEARTERGTVKAVFKSADWRTPPKLTTTTGEIIVWLPPNANTEIRARTAGWLTTDYSLEITSPPEEQMKSAVVKLGDGKHPFAIESTKGNIRLSRLRISADS
ncbi:MAG: DUF4097 family beta strand repeat-containing protein [Acidobacteriota bacterium]